MVTQELLDYVQQQKNAGVTDAVIRQNLQSSGWQPTDIEAVLGGYVPDAPPATATPPTAMSREAATTAVAQMGKFKASWRLFTQSLRLLKKDKEVMWFPVLSAITVSLAAVAFVVALTFSGFVTEQDGETVITNEIGFYSLLFVAYVIIYFLATFFRVGLTAIVFERINGGDIGFKAGFGRASAITGKIFVWSLLAGTVGIILQFIANRSKGLGKLAAWLLGAAWNIVTMFIAPTLLLDNVSVWKSVKNSANVFKQTWGETIIMNVSLYVVSRLVFMFYVIAYMVGLIALFSVGAGTITYIVATAIFFIVVLFTSIVFSSLTEIFKVALYSYARYGIIAEDFSPELILGAIREDKK